MVQVVCHGEQLVANCLTYQKHLVFGGIDASGEHGTVGLELVQVFQFGLDKPGCGVVPLEDDEQIAQQHVNGVSPGDVSALVHQYLTRAVGIVFLIDDYVAEPAERGYFALNHYHLDAAVTADLTSGAYQPPET